MQEVSVKKFIELISYDQDINKREQELDALRKTINTHQDKINQLNTEIQQYKQEADNKKKEVHRKELNMKTLHDTQKEKQQALDRVSTGKEYQALTQEIEAVKQKQYNFETELLQAWHLLEGATRVYETKKKEVDESINQLNQEIVQAQEQASSLEKNIEELYTHRHSKVETIPAELLEKYEIMRKAVSNPAVPIVNNSCSACFYPVNQQELINVRKKHLIQCKECYRFLYREESHEATQPL